MSPFELLLSSSCASAAFSFGVCALSRAVTVDLGGAAVRRCAVSVSAQAGSHEREKERERRPRPGWRLGQARQG